MSKFHHFHEKKDYLLLPSFSYFHDLKPLKFNNSKAELCPQQLVSIDTLI